MIRFEFRPRAGNNNIMMGMGRGERKGGGRREKGEESRRGEG